MLRITDDAIKINHSIEVSGGADPVVHCLPVGLTQGAGMIVIRPCIWSNCRPEYAQSMRVGALRNLLVRCEHAINKRPMLLCAHLAITRQAAKIVYAFKDNHPTRGGWREHISIETRQHIRTKAVGEQVVSADSLIGYADVARCGRALQPRCEDIGPAIVSIRRRTMPVGYRIAKSDDRSRSGRRLDVNFRYLVPVIHMLWFGQRGCANEVSVHIIRSRP